VRTYKPVEDKLLDLIKGGPGSGWTAEGGHTGYSLLKHPWRGGEKVIKIGGKLYHGVYGGSEADNHRAAQLHILATSNNPPAWIIPSKDILQEYHDED
jgi:hypothetical protein